MYLPPQFETKERSQAMDLIRAWPLASLISVDDSGLPFVSHIPLHLEERGEQFALLGHCARANPHWKYLQVRPRAVVTFMGPQAYMSPQVYPDLVRVPTWNYLALHCTVQATLIDKAEAKENLLKKLIDDHDPAYAGQWADLAPDYQQKMLTGIIAFELLVLDWQCKLKLNQHRTESHAKMHAAYASGNANERALADWMVKLGLDVSGTQVPER